MITTLDDLLSHATPEDRETIRAIMEKYPSQDAAPRSRHGKFIARIEWVEPANGFISVSCSCGQHISIRRDAIKAFVMETVADWDKEITARRRKFARLSRLRRRTKAEEPKKAKELQELKRKLRAVLGIKSWGR